MKAWSGLAGAMALGLAHAAAAKEYFVGGPVHQHDMEIVANYLIGVEMAPMTPTMPMGADVIHLEADIHATADNVYGYPDGGWVPYLSVQYTMEKPDTAWKATGTLKPMVAKDGTHYADNVRMNGPGQYHVSYRISPPVVNGFLRHTDKETGVPDWWKPFDIDFTFKYPQE